MPVGVQLSEFRVDQLNWLSSTSSTNSDAIVPHCEELGGTYLHTHTLSHNNCTSRISTTRTLTH